MITWKRPSGSTLETGEGANIEKFAKLWGWVKVGSQSSNDCPLDAMTSKDEIEAYVLDATGVDIDKRGSLDTVKAKARAVLDGNSL